MVVTAMLFCGALHGAGPARIDLGSCANFVLLAHTTITSTGGGAIDGDIGLSPTGSITGFPPATITGATHNGDPLAAQALVDLADAIAAASPAQLPGGVDVGDGELGGRALAPGIYRSAPGSYAITLSDLTLNGGPDDVWIFQMASTLTVGVGRKVILTGGAQSRNVFWQVGSSATLDTSCTFNGTILAYASITINSGATLDGRALARTGAVTFNGSRGSVPNEPAVAMPDLYAGAEDTTETEASPGVLANDTDVDGDALTAIQVTAPAHGTVTFLADGSFVYEPVDDWNGTDTFTYKANDGTLDSNVTTVTITVLPVNDPPVAVPDAYATQEDTPLTVAAPGVLVNDSDVDGDALIAVKVTDPAHGTLALNSDGSFLYTPATNWNGSDAFTYKANDGTADSNVTTVTLTISAANDPPVAVPDAYATPEDTPLTVPAPGVLANDTDVDGDALTAVKVTDPAHGTLALNADGSFLYTPATNWNGPDAFTYQANDGTADSNVTTVTLTVSAVNDPPVAVADTYTVPENGRLSVTAASGTAPLPSPAATPSTRVSGRSAKR